MRRFIRSWSVHRRAQQWIQTGMYYEREDKRSDDWLSSPTDKGRKVWYMSRMREYLNQHIILQYVLRRLVSLIPILLGVTILTYGLMYISPQDPVEMMLDVYKRQGWDDDRRFTSGAGFLRGMDRSDDRAAI